MKVKVIGCGGIGSCLLPVLCRSLNYGFDDVSVTLVDGDDYETRNRERQPFHREGNKAAVTMERLNREFDRIVFASVPEYVTRDNVMRTVRNRDIVFLCVDNHSTRKLVSEHAQTLQNVTVISGGNDYYDGNVQMHIRRDGVDVTLPIANQFHPEILDPQDVNPGEAGCEVLAASGNEQLLVANNFAAALMFNAFYAINSMQQLQEPVDEVYFDLLRQTTRGVVRTMPNN